MKTSWTATFHPHMRDAKSEPDGDPASIEPETDPIEADDASVESKGDERGEKK